jgi:uncharacterized protein YjiS (DUF1127 family)
MFLINLLRFVQQWRRFNAALDYLNRLSDREIADMGAGRSDVIRLAMDESEK